MPKVTVVAEPAVVKVISWAPEEAPVSCPPVKFAVPVTVTPPVPTFRFERGDTLFMFSAAAVRLTRNVPLVVRSTVLLNVAMPPALKV